MAIVLFPGFEVMNLDGIQRVEDSKLSNLSYRTNESIHKTGWEEFPTWVFKLPWLDFIDKYTLYAS